MNCDFSDILIGFNISLICLFHHYRRRLVMRRTDWGSFKRKCWCVPSYNLDTGDEMKTYALTESHIRSFRKQDELYK